MKALIKPADYHKDYILREEGEKLLAKVWHFAGFLRDFEKENDFIALSIGSMPVVIQKIRGEILAFKNVCSHRHSLIQTTPKGNRPLMCPYHGWAYDGAGIPKGIPKKPLFKFDDQALECLKLKSYRIEICGQLVFVCLDEQAPNLINFLGEYFDELATMSSNFGPLADVNQITIKANWKILVENTLESYHVNLIHTDTFSKLGAKGLDFQFDKDHSSWSAPLNANEEDRKVARVHLPFKNRGYKIEGYRHICVFPNTLISTTYGISFNLSSIIPIDSETSLFTSYVFLSKVEGEKNKNTTLEKMYSDSLVMFNRRVFDEDKDICEKVQKGVHHAIYDGELSEEEERVCSFQKAYLKYMTK